MKMTFAPLATSLALATILGTASISANAAANTFNTIYGTNFGSGSTYSTTFLGDVDATFSAKVGSNAGKFSYKTTTEPFNGAGVSPLSGSERTPGEIDIGESITATFSSGIYISGFTLGLLYDGPEFGDINEKAQITAIYADNSVHTFVFTSTGLTSATWTGEGSFTNLSVSGNGSAVWNISNPFGDERVTGLTFTALPGVCGTAGGACNNQSDYTLISVSAVPEPESYAMMLAGLGLMGFVATRRKS